MITTTLEKFITRAASAVKTMQKVASADSDASIKVDVRLRSLRDERRETAADIVLPAMITFQSENLCPENARLSFSESDAEYKRFNDVLKTSFEKALPRRYEGALEDNTIAFGNLLRLNDDLCETLLDQDDDFTLSAEAVYALDKRTVTVSCAAVILELNSVDQGVSKHIFEGTTLAAAVAQAEAEVPALIKAFFNRLRTVNNGSGLNDNAADELAEYYSDLVYEMRDARWKREKNERRTLKQAA